MEPFSSIYRPALFSEVIGQTQHVKNITTSLKKNAIKQALLFTGPAGVGKTTLARLVAKSLNCKSPVDGYEPCNSCDSCVDVKEQKWARNVFMIDAASNRGVETIDELKSSIHTIPMYGDKKKIYILDEAHRLSGTAFDSFLTTLEEPPRHIYFIFCTTDDKKLQKTIKSRCTTFNLGPLKEFEVAAGLAKILDKVRNQKIEKDEMQTLVMVANSAFGCLRDAANTLETLYINDALSSERAKEFIPAFDTTDLGKCITWLVERDVRLLNFIDALDEAKDFELFFFQIRRVVKNTLIVKLGGQLSEPDWIVESSRRNAQKLSQSQIATLLEIFNFDISVFQSIKDHLFTSLAKYFLENQNVSPKALPPPPPAPR